MFCFDLPFQCYHLLRIYMLRFKQERQNLMLGSGKKLLQNFRIIVFLNHSYVVLIIY